MDLRRGRSRLLATAGGALALAVGGMTVAHGALTEVTDSATIPNDITKTAKAVCPGAKHVAFGGFSINTQNDQSPYGWIDSTVPSGTDKWATTAHNESAAPANLKSYAYCYKGTKPAIVKGPPVVAAPTNSDDVTTAQAACSGQKKTLIGGGFSVTGQSDVGRINITEMIRADHRSVWEVGIVNARNTETTLRAIAVCGKGPAPSERGKVEEIEGQTLGPAKANCPNDKEVVFGGVQAENFDGGSEFHAVFPMSLRRQGDGIKVTGLSRAVGGSFGADTSSELRALAYCR